MKIILTKTFKKDFEDLFHNDNFLKTFLKKLKETNFIFLENRLYKFKFYIKSVSVRGIIFLNINDFYIPVLLTKKSDKNIGENLILNKFIKEILDTKLNKMAKDLLSNDYEIFED